MEYIVPQSAYKDGQENYNELKLVELVRNSDDYQVIGDEFMRSTKRNKHDFRENKMYRHYVGEDIDGDTIFIYKIVHKARTEAHDSKRMHLLKTLGNNVSRLNEFALYHGTQLDTLPNVLHQGLLRQFTTRARYGKGIYFARDALLSCHRKYSKPDEDGYQHVLMCNVICGEWTKGREEMKVPPPKKGKKYLPYETTVDNVKDPTIFVTYNDDQALATHLISFKKVSRS